IGRAQVFSPATLLAAAAIVLLFLADQGAGMLLPVLFAIAAGFGLGIAPPTFFAAVADCFHGSHYGAIQGTMILACSLGGALGPWFGGFLHDITGSYQSTLMVVQAFLVVSAVLMWLLKPGRSSNPR
ncbi:MAG: MFS transporter, partial [Chloroflexi bacterium]|nr:MFS transporter [Chloroflexota bacterium]